MFTVKVKNPLEMYYVLRTKKINSHLSL